MEKTKALSTKLEIQFFNSLNEDSEYDIETLKADLK